MVDAGLLVSVVMPAKNAEATIEQSIRCVFSDSVSIELIVIDDGSSDSTVSIVERLSRGRFNIVLRKNEFAPGVSGARNTGLAHANGDLIAFLDADDLLSRGAIYTRRLAFELHPAINMAHGSTVLVNDNVQPLGITVGAPRNVTIKDFTGNPFHISSVMIRKAILGDLRFDETLRNGEDWLFLCEAVSRASESWYVDACISHYRARLGSAVMQNLMEHEATLRGVMRRIYLKRGVPPEKLDAEIATVSARRAIGTLAASILTNKFEDASTLIASGIFDELPEMTIDQIVAAMVTSAKRAAQGGSEMIALTARRNKQPIIDLLAASGLAARHPTLVRALLKLFRMGEPVEIFPPSITAPPLPKA